MTTETVRPSKIRKLVMQLVIGMVVGASVSFAVFHFAKGSGLDIDDPSRASAIGAGLVFALMGALVAFGLAAPGAGSKLLNVENADEIREQRRQLGASASVCVLLGAMLIVLGFGGAVLAGNIAAILAGTLLVALIVVAARTSHLNDEFMRSLGREASTIAAYAATLITAIWAIAAQVTNVPSITPLGAFAGLCSLQLLTVFWVTFRRGLLMPR